MNTPDYNPCRKFRKGDIVTPCQVNGRWWSPVWEDRSGIMYEVTEDECPDSAELQIKDMLIDTPFEVHAAFFELVTPIEERNPYCVSEHKKHVSVNVNIFDFGVVVPFATFNFAHADTPKFPVSKEQALKLAKVLCNRLNAEYRKSTING